MKGHVLAASCLLAVLPGPLAAAQSGREARKALAAADAFFEQARYEEALMRFNKALEFSDGWKTALGQRAMCRWTMGDRAGADEDAREAAQLKPKNAASFTARGLARFVLKDYPAAEADFSQALKVDANWAQAHYGLGGVASSRGDLGRALKNLGEAVRLNPRFATAFLLRGTVQERRKDYAAAISDFDRVLEVNPHFVWAHFYRGKCRREIKDYRNALADFDAFIDAHPDSAEALYLRSNIRFLVGDYAGAESDLNSVITLDPKRGLAYSNRGQARALLGDKDGALSDLRRAIELVPGKRAQIQAAIDHIEESSSAATAPIPGGEPRPSAEPVTSPVLSDAAKIDPEDAPRPKVAPGRRNTVVEDDIPEPIQKGAAPRKDAGKVPAEHNSGQEDSLLIE